MVPSLPFLVVPRHLLAGYGGLPRLVYFLVVWREQEGITVPTLFSYPLMEFRNRIHISVVSTSPWVFLAKVRVGITR